MSGKNKCLKAFFSVVWILVIISMMTFRSHAEYGAVSDVRKNAISADKFPREFTVTYDGNGLLFDNEGTVKQNLVQYLPLDDGSGAEIISGEYKEPFKKGYFFTGWYTDASCAEGTEFDIDTYDKYQDITVYAGNKKGYTVNLYTDINSFKDGSVSKTLYTNENYYLVEDQYPVMIIPAGYVFLGWNTKMDGSGETFEFTGTESLIEDDMDLYAQWESFSVLDTGSSINNTITGIDTEKSVRAVVYSESAPVSLLAEEDTEEDTQVQITDISLEEESAFPVYLWFDDGLTTAYVYSAADKIYFNSDSSYLFQGLSNLEDASVVDHLYMDRVKNASYFMSGCSSINATDEWSDWNTSNVTNLSYAFNNCTSLSSMEFMREWDLMNTKYLSNMFYGCKGVTSVDMSGMNLPEVISMESMFDGCSGVISADMSNLKFPKCTNIKRLFAENTSMVSCDMQLDVSAMQNVCCTFYNCASLTSVAGITDWNTQNFTDMGHMFYGCASLESCDFLKLWDYTNATSMMYMFQDCVTIPKVEFSGMTLPLCTSMKYMFYGCTSVTSIDFSDMVAPKMKDFNSTFRKCTSAVSADMSNITADALYWMHYIFEGCTSLKTLDVSGWETPGITKYGYDALTNCSSLETVDASNTLFQGKVNILGQLAGKTSLKYVDLSNSKFDSYKTASNLFKGCTGLETVDVTNLDLSNVTSLQGTFTKCSSLTSIPGHADLDVKTITTFQDCFSGDTALVTLDLSKWNTVGASNLQGFLSDCVSLSNDSIATTKNWDTSSVTNISYAFNNCDQLTYLDLSNWNVQKVTTINRLCSYSALLETLDVSNWVTDALTIATDVLTEDPCIKTVYMHDCTINNTASVLSSFAGVTSLEYVDMHNTVFSSKYTSFANAFSGCAGLKTVDMQGVDMSYVASMAAMFKNCSGLKEILGYKDLNTASVTNMSELFSGCATFVWDDISGIRNWCFDNVTTIGNLFSNCTSLERIDFSALSFPVCTEFNNLVSNDSALTEINWNSVSTPALENASYMFADAPAIVTLTAENWIIPSTADDLSYMFKNSGTISYENLNMGNWDYSGVTTMAYMFQGTNVQDDVTFTGDFHSLTSLEGLFNSATINGDVTMNGDYTSVTTMANIFYGSVLNNIDLTDMELTACTSLENAFRGLTAESMTINTLNTSTVTTLAYAFYGTNVSCIDLSGWDVSSVKYVAQLFRNSTVEVIHLCGLNFPGSITNTNNKYLFYGCTNLTTIYGTSDWTTFTIYGFSFSGCTNLVGDCGHQYQDTSNNTYSSNTYLRLDSADTVGFMSLCPDHELESIAALLVLDANGGTVENKNVLEITNE